MITALTSISQPTYVLSFTIFSLLSTKNYLIVYWNGQPIFNALPTPNGISYKLTLSAQIGLNNLTFTTSNTDRLPISLALINLAPLYNPPVNVRNFVNNGDFSKSTPSNNLRTFIDGWTGQNFMVNAINSTLNYAVLTGKSQLSQFFTFNRNNRLWPTPSPKLK